VKRRPYEAYGAALVLVVLMAVWATGKVDGSFRKGTRGDPSPSGSVGAACASGQESVRAFSSPFCGTIASKRDASCIYEKLM